MKTQKQCLFLIILILFQFRPMNAQDTIFPFNYLSAGIKADSLMPILEASAFDGYYSEKRQLLLTRNSDFWKNLHIWHFEEGYGRDAVLSALFSIDEQNQVQSLLFSSSNIAEIGMDGRSATMEDYFKEYGTAIITYLQTLGWVVDPICKSFPFEMSKEQMRLTIWIDTLYDVAINPEVDGVTGFHFDFPQDHIPSPNKYLRFKVVLE